MVSFSHNTTPISHPFMWGMWVIFIPYYTIGFHRFENKKILSILLAFIFAPISYYSGVKQGALEISSLYNLVAVGILWGVFFPLSIKIFSKVKNGIN
jgi:hypothetical protein